MAILTSKRTEEQMVQDGQQRLSENVGINSTNSTATARNLVEMTSSEMSNMWDTMNDSLLRGFLTTSYGDSLDKIGEGKKEPRSNAKRALDLGTNNFQFYLDTAFASSVGDLIRRYYTDADKVELFDLGLTDSATNPTQLNIPESVTVTSEDGGIGYTTVNPVVLSNSQPIDYTPVIANGAGSTYNVGVNSLINHNLHTLYPQLGKIISAIRCKNKFAIRSGTDYEGDENYRFRIANKTVAARAGNDSAIRAAVLSVPGVVDMSLVKRSHGAGTFTIFPRTVDPIVSDGIVNAVTQSVNSIKSGSDIVYVTVPTYLAVVLRLDLRLGPGADRAKIFGDARIEAMDYINNLVEGDEIIINEIIQRVMAVDDKIQDMIISEFGFGDYDRNTGVLTGYSPLRLVNQRADWSERWYTSTQFCSVCEQTI